MRDEYLKGRGTPGQGGVEIGPVLVRVSVAPLQGMQRSRTDGSKTKVEGAHTQHSRARFVLRAVS